MLVAINDGGIGCADNGLAFLISTNAHGAEFCNSDYPATAPNAFLEVEHRPAAGQLGADASNDHERQEEQEEQNPRKDVEAAFDGALRAGQVRLIKVQQRKIGGHAHCHPRAGDVADRRSNQEVNTWAFESPRQTLHHLMTKGRRASNCNGIGVL